MGRRKQRFDEPEEYEEAEAAEQALEAQQAAARCEAAVDEGDDALSHARKRAKARDEDAAHTLESDEEDVEEKKAGQYELQDEDVHEELDEKFEDGGVEVTAFNLKDELDEGHFDKDGNFIFKKKGDGHEGDAWLQGAEVYDPKRKVKFQGKHQREADREQQEAALPSERYAIIEAVIPMLHEQETVAAAMKRLGGQGGQGRKVSKRLAPSEAALASEARAAAAAAADSVRGEGASRPLPHLAPKEKDLKQLDRLTQLADLLMSDGMYDIFEHSKEKLAVALKEKNVPKFIYKWTDEEEAEIHGPFTAQQMLEWQRAGFFGTGIFVREVTQGKQGLFYPLARMDFELFVDE